MVTVAVSLLLLAASGAAAGCVSLCSSQWPAAKRAGDAVQGLHATNTYCMPVTEKHLDATPSAVFIKVV
jgi:hypothetical protein